jgi:hypothetical protein
VQRLGEGEAFAPDPGFGWLTSSAAGADATAPAQRADAGALAASAAGGGAAGPSERDLELLAGRLFDRIERQLRAELIADRERTGALVDIGR